MKTAESIWQLRFGPSISAMSRDRRGPWNFDPAQFGMLMISGMSTRPGYVFHYFFKIQFACWQYPQYSHPIPQKLIHLIYTYIKCFILFPKILEHLGAFLKKASFIWPISHIILSGCPPCQAFSLLTSQGIAIGQPSCPNSRPPGWS